MDAGNPINVGVGGGDLEPARAPFSERPCQCVKRHSPKAERIEEHHVYPRGEQIKRHGEVIDDFTEPLCDSGHANVHIGIRRLQNGEGSAGLGNNYLEAVAHAGYNSILGGARVEILLPQDTPR